MITIGVDAHKRIHVATAVDGAGQELESWRGPNSARGWRRLQRWAEALGEQRRWGIEGAWGYGRGLAQLLVSDGETVYEINARWTARERRSARRPGKTDRLDAHAIAQLVRQESPHLPVVHADDSSTLLDILSTEREGVIAEVVRLRNQIHALLTQLDPEYQLHLPRLDSKAGVAAAQHYETTSKSVLQQTRAANVRRLAARLDLALQQAAAIAEEIQQLAKRDFEPLTQICGVNLLTAGTLAGILGPGQRFVSDAQLAAYAGVSPLEASSAGAVRHRLNRGGNRRLNSILHRIVLTQAHAWPEARAYLDRKVAEGKSRREAMRALKRYVARSVWRLWQECAAGQRERATELKTDEQLDAVRPFPLARAV
jgi:transposase